MKKILVFVVLLFASVAASAQGRLQAMFSYSTFYLVGEEVPYVETYLSFDAWTMQFEELESGVWRGSAEVSIVLSQGDSVCYSKLYTLNSPTVGSLQELDFNFIDVQRFTVRNGLYDLEVSVRDKVADTPPSVVSEKLVVNYDNRRPAMSSVQLMASATPTEVENVLSRNGYDMEPYVSDFFPEQVEALNFYYEVYNIGLETGKKPFLTMAYVEERETGVRFDEHRVMARKYSTPTVPVYGSIDISQLPSGNFNLVVELRNSDNQLMLYKKVPFLRSNPEVKGREMSDYASTFAGSYNDEAALNLYLDALYPIASDAERSVVRDIVRRPGVTEKQAFLYRFWQRRNALSPESEWLKYKERVDYVQATFSYPRTRGIDTDRGRVYLQYGPPDFVRDEKNFVSTRHLEAGHSNVAGSVLRTQSTQGEAPVNLYQDLSDGEGDQFASASQGHVYYLPYQLWRYNKPDGDDPNRVFLFWDEHRSGYYKLLNSNAKGEVQEPGWERRLSRQQLGEGVEGAVGEQFKRGY